MKEGFEGAENTLTSSCRNEKQSTTIERNGSGERSEQQGGLQISSESLHL